MDDERPNKSSPRWVIVVVLLLATIVLYVLSTGPAVWLRNRGAISQEQLLAVYAPLSWLYDVVPFFKDALDAYLWLWVGDSQAPPATKS
jgi:hypothetical protein